MSRRKRVAFVLLSVLMGLTVSLVASELGMRAFGLRPERYPPAQWRVLQNGVYRTTNMWGDGLIKRPSRFADQGVVMGEYVPGAQFKVVYASNPRGYFDADNGVPMKINSLGLRGPEISEKKPPGTFRLLGVGDSFTFGVGVRDADTFLRRLEKSLNANPPSEHKFEVLNAGTQGYNTRDEILYLEHRWLALDADLVLISFYLNDAYADEAFLNNGQGLGIYLKEPQGLARYSRVLDFLQYNYRAREVRQTMRDYYSQHFFAKPRQFFRSTGSLRADWHMSRAALEHAVKLSGQHKFQLVLVIFPEFQDLDGVYPFEAVHDLVRTACESMGLPVLDLLDTFRGRRDRDLWVHPSDHHPNEIAHAMAAKAIETFLRERFFNKD